MKAQIYIKYLLLLFVVLFSVTVMLHAQTYSDKREQSRSFKIKSGTVVQITNKYGNVNIMPWEKDSVRIEVSMTAQSKQAAKVVKVLTSIDCEMISSANSISARTVFYDNSTTFWKDVVSYAGQVINTNNNLQINYTVYMPATNDIKIDNKFGNVYMDNHSGNADLTISNGDLQARNITGKLKLKIEFGSASMQDLDDAQLNINYSDLMLRKVKKLNLNSRSSTIDMEEAAAIELISTRDKLNVKRCGSLSGESSFSRIGISELESSCTLTAKYGALKLSNVKRNFSSIHVKSEYADLYFGFNTEDSYSLDLIYDAKTNLNFSSPINIQLKKETLDAKAGTIKATGTIGTPGDSGVSITQKAGSLSVLNK